MTDDVPAQLEDKQILFFPYVFVLLKNGEGGMSVKVQEALLALWVSLWVFAPLGLAFSSVGRGFGSLPGLGGKDEKKNYSF